MAQTVLDLITDALQDLGAIAIEESPSSAEAASALRALTNMVDQWNSEGLMVYNIVETEFNLVPGQQVYSLGTGGDFNIPRPAEVNAAYYRDARGIDYPVYMTTNFQEYADITYKTVQTPIASVIYDDNNFPLKNLHVYPVPSGTAYRLVLWTAGIIDSVTTLSTEIALPPGYRRALEYNLAIELAPKYGKAVSQELAVLAIESKAQVKRTNAEVNTLKIPRSIPQTGSRYSLQDFYSGR